jgi:hypothetical protein
MVYKMGAVFFAPLPSGGYATRESDSSDPRAGPPPLSCDPIARGRVATERLGTGSTMAWAEMIARVSPTPVGLRYSTARQGWLGQGEALLGCPSRLHTLFGALRRAGREGPGWAGRYFNMREIPLTPLTRLTRLTPLTVLIVRGRSCTSVYVRECSWT